MSELLSILGDVVRIITFQPDLRSVCAGGKRHEARRLAPVPGIRHRDEVGE